MSFNYGEIAMPNSLNKSVLACKKAADCLIPMGKTSENVAERFGVNRQRQDEFAVESHLKAFKSQTEKLFEQEIVPVQTVIKDEKIGSWSEIVVAQDDGIRGGTTPEQLGRLRPSFKESGSTTAGNSSQISDGAAAVLLMKRKTAKRLTLPILAKFVDFTVAGVAPDIMGIGPAVAIPQLMNRNNLAIEQIDVFEINEAFASQAAYCIDVLKIAPAKVNINGGAIALGHPLGCTGARQIATLLPLLRRHGARRGVVSMCIGSGMGAAALIENEASDQLTFSKL